MALSDTFSNGQYALRTPAHRFIQGGRHVFSFTLDLPTLDRLLPERVNDKVVEDANRPLTASHARKIQDYLETRNNWLLGTLLLGIDPGVTEFSPYPGQPDEKAVIVGELRVRATRDNPMSIFDGQHRRRAIKDALNSLAKSGRSQGRLSDLQGASVPIMLYAEPSIDALRQMFADASKTRSIESNTVTQFDQRDAFNLAAMSLSGISEFLKGRVEMEKSSVARSSENIISINQLAGTLKTLDVGYKGRVSKERNAEYLLDVDALVDRCLVWSDEFLPSARQEYDDLLAGEIDNSDIPAMRTNTLAYNATVIRIFAGCYHEWTKDSPDWTPLAEFIREASLKSGAMEDTLLVDSGAVIPGGVSPIARAEQMTRSIDYIVSQARANGN